MLSILGIVITATPAQQKYAVSTGALLSGSDACPPMNASTAAAGNSWVRPTHLHRQRPVTACVVTFLNHAPPTSHMQTESHCNSECDGCAGFTFECADGASECSRSSVMPMKTYFKSSTAGNAGAKGWWTYTKVRSTLLATSFADHMV